MGAEAVRNVSFARTKYGRELRAEAGDLGAFSGFFLAGEAHALDFYELMVVSSGEARATIAGRTTPMAPGTALWTVPGEARRIHAGRGFDAQLVVFERAFVEEAVIDPVYLSALDRMADRSQAFAVEAPEQRHMIGAIAPLAYEMRHLRGDSAWVLRAGICQLLVQLARHAGGALREPGLVRELRALVDARFRDKRRVADYAKMLGVTPGHLSREARSAGTTPRAILEGRILAEAKRMLRATGAPVAEIAGALGFVDPSHFVRVFRRRVGTTPGRFRSSHLGS